MRSFYSSYIPVIYFTFNDFFFLGDKMKHFYLLDLFWRYTYFSLLFSSRWSKEKYPLQIPLLCCFHVRACFPMLAGLPSVVQFNLQSATFVRKRLGKKQCAPLLQFGEIYEWTKPKSVRLYTQLEFGRRDLRCSVATIIQSSCSHISHFESHRLWERRDLSSAQVAHVQGREGREKRKTAQLCFPHVLILLP